MVPGREEEDAGAKARKTLKGAGLPANRIVFSEKFACPVSGFTIEEIEPRLFSFNAPQGACPACDGLGEKLLFDPQLVVPNEALTLKKGAVVPWAKSNPPSPYYMQVLGSLAAHFGFDLDTPWEELPGEAQLVILYGTGGKAVPLTFKDGRKEYTVNKAFEGVIGNLNRRMLQTDSAWMREELSKYQTAQPCETCHGKRLKPEALAVKIAGSDIADAARLSVADAYAWFGELAAKLTDQQQQIARAILKEINERLGFLNNVGLDYLNLDRTSGTLSGGESQRIRLASQIGSGLSGVLYVLDEPTIGLHQRDNDLLLATLRRLRDLGNTVIVVEHDEDAIRTADHVVDSAPAPASTAAKSWPKARWRRSSKPRTASPPSTSPAPAKSTSRPSAARATARKSSVENARANNLKGVTATLPARHLHLRHRRLRLRQIHPHHRHPPGRRQPRALNGARVLAGAHDKIKGLETLRQGHRDRPVADRPHPALEPRHLHRRLHPDPRLVRRPARKPGARLQTRPLQLQRQGRPLRSLPGRRPHQDRNALPPRRLRHLRGMPRQTLQPRNARSEVQGQVHRRRARHDHRGRRGILQGRARRSATRCTC